MGQNNRQRRAAKQRQRAAQHRSHQARDPHAEHVRHEAPPAEPDLSEHLSQAVGYLFAAGWTPLDLVEVVRRNADPDALGWLGPALRRTTARSGSTPDPRWLAELDGADDLGHTAISVDQQRRVLALLTSLPRLTVTIPPPGQASAARGVPTGIDARMLAKVRALLAKAESTQFEEEADAFTAKAQELMTRYSIDHALAAPAADTGGEKPDARRVWLDAPYVNAKAMLVSAVASANHAKAVMNSEFGFVTILGFDADLDVVELLTASLLVQATRAMTLAGSHTTHSGVPRTRSFRQSFLVAYARRIGERLRETAETAEAEADSLHSGALVPVLASRDRSVDDALTDRFPSLRKFGVNVSNAAGYGAGRAAADLARFDLRGGLPGERAG
jgi:hypothetical protein